MKSMGYTGIFRQCPKRFMVQLNLKVLEEGDGSTRQ